MFDDQLPPTPAGAQPPANLPLGNVDDMFANVDVGEAAPVAQPSPLDAPSALEAGILRPAQPQEAPRPPAPTAQPMGGGMPPEFQRPMTSTMPEQYALKEPTLSRGIMTTIILVVVVAVLAAGGWFIYRLLRVPATPGFPVEEPTQNDDPVVVPISGENDPLTEDPQEDTSGTLDDRILFGEPIDSDADGLSDDDEQARGTDAQNWDSDADELRDGDEVLIWKTDPMNPDSDGDTYLDGMEVKSGYNPAGPGRFVAPPVVSSTPTRAATPLTGDIGASIELQLSLLSNTSCSPLDVNRFIQETADIFTMQGLLVPLELAEKPELIRDRAAWSADVLVYDAFLKEIVSRLPECGA